MKTMTMDRHIWLNFLKRIAEGEKIREFTTVRKEVFRDIIRCISLERWPVVVLPKIKIKYSASRPQ